MLAISHSIHLILLTLLVTSASLIPMQPAYAADTEVAHIWRFEYQHASGQGILDIMIVEHEKDTHEIIQIFDQFSYAVPCTQNGGSISCNLDIKSAIQDSYLQMDLKDQAAKVRASESYRWMQTELTGSWSSLTANRQYKTVDHQSLLFFTETNGTGSALRYKNVWNQFTATSAYYRPTLGESVTLVNNFSCPIIGSCVSTNYALTSRGTKDLGSTQLSIATVGFQLVPNQLLITPPPGFQLNSFVIDPPKAGYG